MKFFLMSLPFILTAITYVLAFIHDNVLPKKCYPQKVKTIITIFMLLFGISALISTILIYLVFNIV